MVADIEEMETVDASEIYSKKMDNSLIRDHPIRGESRRNFVGEWEGSLPTPPQDSFPVKR